MNFDQKIQAEEAYLSELKEIGFVDVWQYLEETELQIQFNFSTENEFLANCYTHHNESGDVANFSAGTLCSDKEFIEIFKPDNNIKSFLLQCREKQKIKEDKQHFENFVAEAEEKPKKAIRSDKV